MAWLVLEARAKGRAEHNAAQCSTAKEEWPGGGFKRVSGRVIFHASTTTMRTRHEQRRGKRSVEKRCEERGGKKKSPRPGLNDLRIDKDGHAAEVSAKKDAARRGWECVA